jgi:hypothetical protein
MESKFYIKDLEHGSVWKVSDIDLNDPIVKDGWLTAFCIDEGDEPKAFVGCKLQIAVMTIFERPDKYDVSKSAFHLKPHHQ